MNTVSEAEVGWGIKEVIYIFLLRFVIGFVITRVLAPFTGNLSPVLVTIMDRVITIGLVYYFISKTSKDWLSAVGFKTDNILRQVVIGLLAGVILLVFLNIGEKIIAGLMALDIKNHPLVSSASNARTIGQLILPLMAGGLFTPVAEEMLYRGIIYPVISRRTGVILGVIVSALIFTIFHFSVYWFAEIFFIGLVFTVMFIKTGSIIPSMIAHALINSWRLIAAFLY